MSVSNLTMPRTDGDWLTTLTSEDRPQLEIHPETNGLIPRHEVRDDMPVGKIVTANNPDLVRKGVQGKVFWALVIAVAALTVTQIVTLILLARKGQPPASMPNAAAAPQPKQEAALPKEAAKNDLKKLQGKWKTVAIVHQGVAQPPAVNSAPWIITGNKILYSGSTIEEEMTLDETKSPKTMDIRVLDPGVPPREHKGIYALDGDRLQICFDLNDLGRPTALESRVGSSHRFITLERVKE